MDLLEYAEEEERREGIKRICPQEGIHKPIFR
jgi:hypothetical protein